jgi:FtsZ-interacting cell division protein ZipA
MPGSVVVVIGVVVLAVVGYVVVDLWDSRRQRARLRGQQGRSDVSHHDVRGEKTITDSFGATAARTVGDKNNRYGKH